MQGGQSCEVPLPGNGPGLGVSAPGRAAREEQVKSPLPEPNPWSAPVRAVCCEWWHFSRLLGVERQLKVAPLGLPACKAGAQAGSQGPCRVS